MCLTELTSIDCGEELVCPIAPLPPLDDVEADVVVPVILIVWPTCSLSFEVSPVSAMLFPWLSVRV